MMGGMKGAMDVMTQFARIPAPVKRSLGVLCELAAAAEVLGVPAPGGAALMDQVETETGTPAALLAAFYSVIHHDQVVRMGADGTCRTKIAAAVVDLVQADGRELIAAAGAGGWAAAVIGRVEQLRTGLDAQQLRLVAGQVATTYALFLARRAPASYMTGLANTFHG